MNSRWVTTACTVGALTGFAANSLLTRAAVGPGAIDAVAFTTVRLVTGALALSLLVSALNAPAPAPALRVRQPMLAGAATLAGYAYAFAFAYARIDAGIGALVLFSAVQLTMTCGGLIRGDRPRALEWVGLAAALTGLVVLTRPGHTAPDAAGSALMAAAGASWGVYSLLGRTASAPLRATARNFVAAGLVGVLVAGLAAPLHVSGRGVWLATLSGALASGVGYALWYRALPAVPPFRAALVQLAVPVVTAGAAWLLLGEPITGRLAASAALILGGILLAFTARRT